MKNNKEKYIKPEIRVTEKKNSNVDVMVERAKTMSEDSWDNVQMTADKVWEDIVVDTMYYDTIFAFKNTDTMKDSELYEIVIKYNSYTSEFNKNNDSIVAVPVDNFKIYITTTAYSVILSRKDREAVIEIVERMKEYYGIDEFIFENFKNTINEITCN